ncbi:MAG: S8 family serine peptidase [Sinomicrobium sp.]|nr:S8 family serine peptidase [Sinomicrobium sp.]
MKRILFFALFLMVQAAPAQEHAWVYFTDKENVAQALANPITILSQEAIDRKNLHGIPIDDRDVPVNADYVNTIEAQPGITVYARSKWFNCVHVIGTEADVNALSALPFVSAVFFANRSLNPGAKSAKPLRPHKLQNKFNTEQTDFTYGNSATQVQMLNVQTLHQQDYTGEGMVIAVMDGGFPNVDTMDAFQRMRDNGDLLGGYNFVSGNTDYTNPALSSHGTRVLSDMAGYIQNEFVGTAPDAGYYLFVTEDVSDETPLEESYWVAAAERADSLGVGIINTSLGYSEFADADYDYTTSDMDGNTAFITLGANIAVEKGMLVVCSAGNSGDDAWGIITAPADGNVFTVGAVNAAENYALFSSRGPAADGRIKPDGMAMGQLAAVVGPDDMIYFNNGTSFAAPVMTGALASLWQSAPDMTNLEIMQAVRESSSNYATPNAQLGYGIPDFQTALNTVSSIQQKKLQDISIYPNPVSSYFEIAYASSIGEIKAEVYDILGKKVLSQTVSPENKTIHVAKLSKGIYMVRLTSGAAVKIFKIVKQ